MFDAGGAQAVKTSNAMHETSWMFRFFTTREQRPGPGSNAGGPAILALKGRSTPSLPPVILLENLSFCRCALQNHKYRLIADACLKSRWAAVSGCSNEHGQTIALQPVNAPYQWTMAIVEIDALRIALLVNAKRFTSCVGVETKLASRVNMNSTFHFWQRDARHLVVDDNPSALDEQLIPRQRS